MSINAQEVDALVAHAEKAIAGGIGDAERQIGQTMTEAQKSAFVADIVARVKRQLATPADQIAEQVLRKIATKAVIVPRERVIVLDTARERTARKMLQHG